MNVLIVDDERPAREEMAWLLGQCDDVVVCGQCASAEDALERLADDRNAVDLVFLDIDMPGIGGMRLAELLGDADERPQVVFVTAYEKYAVDAFGVDAVDYLLKPVRLDRLQRALDKARERVRASDAPPRTLTRISVEDRGEYRVVPLEDVLFFESEEGIVVLQTTDARYITEFSLKFLEQKLDPKMFFRSHRGYIVRLDAITSIAPWGAGTYRLVLDRERDLGVPLARSRAADLKSLIPWSASAFD